MVRKATPRSTAGGRKPRAAASKAASAGAAGAGSAGAGNGASGGGGSGMADAKARIVDAFMALAGERRFSEIDLPDIAERAGVSLGELRAQFDGRLSILSAFSERIDRQVLDAVGPTTEESGRDRLFEVLMRRLDALAPYRAAVELISEAARRDPALAAGLHAIALRSMRWMMVAAGVSPRRPGRMVRLEGLTLVWLRTLRTFVDDTDADLGATMAGLDKDLRRGERMLESASRVREMLCWPLRRGDARRGAATAGEGSSAAT